MYDFDSVVDDARSRFAFSEGNLPPQHQKLLGFLKRLRRAGEEAIKDRLADMEKADQMYQAYRPADEEDIKASERKEPIKIIYPITYAQCQTGVAQLLSIFVKNPFFELDSRGPRLYKNSKLMELELQYELEQDRYILKLYQAFLDTMRYGFAKLNIGYVKHRSKVPPVGLLDTILQMVLPSETIVYEGAEILNENPKEVIFDPNFSVGDFQRGSFVFSRQRVTYNELRSSGLYFNLEEIPVLQETGIESVLGRPTFPQKTVKGGDIVILDTCYVKLVPKEYELSPSDSVEIWKFCIANESRIILLEPLRHYHGKFPSVIMEYSPDLFRVTNDGLAQTINGLQDHLNWLLNSHMQSVRKTINNMAIVDPDIIEIEDLEKRRNYIRVKRGKGGLLERAWRQISFADVTQAHVRDAQTMMEFIQRTTSVSDNTMGVQMPTMRTATEVATIQRQGNVRMRTLAQLIFEQALRPLGEQMIQNVQQFMEGERFLKVTGDLAMQLGINPAALEDGLLRVRRSDLQGFFSFKMIDPSTIHDKMAIASALKELLIASSQRPEFVPVMGINPKAVLQRILMLQGVQGISDLMTPETPPIDSTILSAMAAGRPIKAEVLPEEKVANMLAKGDIIPNNGNPGPTSARTPIP